MKIKTHSSIEMGKTFAKAQPLNINEELDNVKAFENAIIEARIKQGDTPEQAQAYLSKFMFDLTHALLPWAIKRYTNLIKALK